MKTRTEKEVQNIIKDLKVHIKNKKVLYFYDRGYSNRAYACFKGVPVKIYKRTARGNEQPVLLEVEQLEYLVPTPPIIKSTRLRVDELVDYFDYYTTEEEFKVDAKKCLESMKGSITRDLKCAQKNLATLKQRIREHKMTLCYSIFK